MSKRHFAWAALVAYLATGFWLPFIQHHRWAESHFSWAEYGTWLGGTLTPALLLFAVIMLKGDTEAQREANRLTTHALFMANIEGYLLHLNHVCTVAVTGHWIPAKEAVVEDLEGIARLLDIVTAKRADAKYPPGHRLEAMTYDQILASKELTVVTRDLDAVIKLARRADVEFLLDPRVIELQDALQLRRRRKNDPPDLA